MHNESNEVAHVAHGLAVALLEAQYVLADLLDDEQSTRHQVGLVYFLEHFLFFGIEDQVVDEGLHDQADLAERRHLLVVDRVDDGLYLDTALVPNAHLQLVGDAILHVRRLVDDGAQDEILHLVAYQCIDLQREASVQDEKGMLRHGYFGAFRVSLLLTVGARLAALLGVLTDEFIEVVAQEQRKNI